MQSKGSQNKIQNKTCKVKGAKTKYKKNKNKQSKASLNKIQNKQSKTKQAK